MRYYYCFVATGPDAEIARFNRYALAYEAELPSDAVNNPVFDDAIVTDLGPGYLWVRGECYDDCDPVFDMAEQFPALHFMGSFMAEPLGEYDFLAIREEPLGEYGCRWNFECRNGEVLFVRQEAQQDDHELQSAMA